MRYGTVAWTAQSIFVLIHTYLQTSNVNTNVNAQGIIGTDICYCQPAVYEFKFNFSLTCPDRDITNSTPGIFDVGCLVESRGATQNLTNPFPILVSDVQIIELDQQDLIVGQAVYTNTYSDGDIITYTSVVSTSPDQMNSKTLPRAFQVTMTGLNSDEQSLTNLWIIRYDNDCGIFPLLTEGMKVGWTIFNKIGDPPSAFCPLAATPTTPSSVAPVSPSSVAPVTMSSDSPSIGPSSAATNVSPNVPDIICPTFAPISDGISVRTPAKAPIRTKRIMDPKQDDVHKSKAMRQLRVHYKPRSRPVSPSPSECPEIDTNGGTGTKKKKGEDGSKVSKKSKQIIKTKKMKVSDDHRHVDNDE